MESVAVLRSLQCAISPNSRAVFGKPCNAAITNLAPGGKTISCPNRQKTVLVSCVKASTTSATAISSTNGYGLPNKNKPFSATFPTGFETLLEEICDETDIGQLKVKFGSFEMHMRRNIESPAISRPAVAQPNPPPISVHQAIESAPPASPKSSSEKATPFTNIFLETAARLATLEGSGSNNYVTVPSPMVGSFQRGRTLKGKKQPPACKEGDIIKKGQVIGFLDQCGTQLHVKSDVAGVVLKLLYNDGETVGYGDPLIAVLPLVQ